MKISQAVDIVGLERSEDQKTKSEMNLLCCAIFPDGFEGYLPSGYHEWSTQHHERIKHYVTEFVVNYRRTNKDEKKDGAVMPTTMKTNITGIQSL